MQGIELELNGVSFRARLLTAQAPESCRALWEAMPLAAQAVHAKWSGNLIRTLDPLPLRVAGLEQPRGFQYPGLIAYSPETQTLAITYGDARLRGAAGACYVTPVAELLGDLSAFSEVAATLQWQGAAPLQLRQAEVSIPVVPRSGTQIELDLDGVIATATLLETDAPRTCAALRALLPLEGDVVNTKWSGDMVHFWGPDRSNRGSIGLDIEPLEHPTRFHWPGYLYYYPGRSGIRIPYGDAQMGGAFRTLDMTAFAQFDGDWSEFRDAASQLYRTGSRSMSIRLKE